MINDVCAASPFYFPSFRMNAQILLRFGKDFAVRTGISVQFNWSFSIINVAKGLTEPYKYISALFRLDVDE